MNHLPSFLSYSLQAGIALGVLYLFYRIFLVRLTFYKANRFYLVGYSLLGPLVPLMDTSRYWSYGVRRYTGYINQFNNVTFSGPSTPLFTHAPATAGTAHAAIDMAHLAQGLQYIVFAGMAVMLVRLLIQWISLTRVKSQSTRQSNGLYALSQPMAPFSFGNNVFVHLPSHSQEDLQRIIAHETVHIRQRHTIDICLCQALLIVQWWSPFAWMLDRSVRQNLEFLADEGVLHQGVDRREYQYLLLQVSGIQVPALCNAFNFSPLRNRIAMMNKKRSTQVQVTRFLFALPVLVILLAAFSRHLPEKNPDIHPFVGFVVDAMTLKPLEGVAVMEKNSGLHTVTDAKGYFRINLPLKNTTRMLSVKVTFVKDGLDTSYAYDVIKEDSTELHEDFQIGTMTFIGMAPPAIGDSRFSNTRSLSAQESESVAGNDSGWLKGTYDHLVLAQKEDQKLRGIFKSTTNIYQIIGGNTYITNGSGYAERDGIVDVIVVDDTVKLTGAEVNQRYSRSQIFLEGTIDAKTAERLYGINKDVMIFQLKKR